MHFIVFVNIRRRDCHKGWTKNIKLQTLVHIVAKYRWISHVSHC